MRCILSELVRQQRLIATPEFDIDSPKTSKLKDTLSTLDISNCLIILSNPSENLQRAASNLKHVSLLAPSRVNPVDLLNFEKILVDTQMLRQLETNLS